MRLRAQDGPPATSPLTRAVVPQTLAGSRAAAGSRLPATSHAAVGSTAFAPGRSYTPAVVHTPAAGPATTRLDYAARLSARNAQRQAALTDPWMGDKTRHLRVPLIICFVSAIALIATPLAVASQTSVSGTSRVALFVFFFVALYLFIMLPAMLAASFITADVMNVGFGTLRSAILKLCAIALMPFGIELIGYQLTGSLDALGPKIIAIALYYVLFLYFFEIGFLAITVFGFISWIIRMGVTFLIAILFHLS